MVSLVVTVIAPDRPGLVEALANAVAAHQGNWVESRMAHLAGQFAGILRVEVPPTTTDALMAALQSLERQGLHVMVEKDTTDLAAQLEPALRMELVGNDRPGIVREVSQALAAQQVNVEEFQTECDTAAMSGGSLFRATARLRLPATLCREDLQASLEKIAHDLMVDIQLESPDDA